MFTEKYARFVACVALDILEIKMEKAKEVVSSQSYRLRQMRHRIAVVVPRKPEVGYLRYLRTFSTERRAGFLVRETIVLFGNSSLPPEDGPPYDNGNSRPKD